MYVGTGVARTDGPWSIGFSAQDRDTTQPHAFRTDDVVASHPRIHLTHHPTASIHIPASAHSARRPKTEGHCIFNVSCVLERANDPSLRFKACLNTRILKGSFFHSSLLEQCLESYQRDGQNIP